jgi:biotin operon repressor
MNEVKCICQKYFAAGLSISETRINTVARNLHEGGLLKENMGGDGKSMKYADTYENYQESEWAGEPL